GSAGGALAGYAARAGLEAHVFMPRDTPRANIVECRELGAHVNLIDGLITDCGAEIARRKAAEGWFDMSTLREPYRVEGKKTLGYELADQLDWQLPDVILYPTGGGAVAVDDEEMIRVTREVGSSEGLFVSPEGAACFAALKSLYSAGKIGSAERVVIFNTGSGIKYVDCYQA